MSTKAKIYKKLHRWPGLILSIFLLYYGVTGIFMNHRETFSALDISRSNLPDDFHYKNWNNGALKGSLNLNADSILVYGNIGVWLTDSTYSAYHSLNEGFPLGSDNRKIFDLHRSADGHLYAATQFGLYAYDKPSSRWVNLGIEVDIKRFVAVESVGDTLYVLNRSYLFKGLSQGSHTQLQQVELKAPAGYTPEVSLFEMIWQIHSGEIFGLPGKLVVDALGLITVFLSLTGIIYFLFPGWIKRRKKKQKNVSTMVRTNRWSLKWHNKTGAWLLGGLIVLYFTGMFLRPPLLIAIAYAKVSPLKYSHLDQANPWYDKLRDLKYDEESGGFILATSEGLFFMDKEQAAPVKFRYQPPVSVMGINVLESYNQGSYLVGSFSGLFLWHPNHPQVVNYPLGQVYAGTGGGRPVGDFKVTGLMTTPGGQQFMVDYGRGVMPLFHKVRFPEMPDEVRKASGMSLWNLSLEIHTGRYFSFLLSDFYILLVPLSGLFSLMVVLSGYLLWRKKFRKPRKSRTRG